MKKYNNNLFIFSKIIYFTFQGIFESALKSLGEYILYIAIILGSGIVIIFFLIFYVLHDTKIKYKNSIQ